MRFRTLLLPHHDGHCVERITSTLDRMDPKSRLWTVLSIEAKEQAVLWDLFSESSSDAEQFVPAGTEPLETCVHHGKNSLPAFKLFQKRFCRADDDSGNLWGYNVQPWTFATGPGYFVAHAADSASESAPLGFVIDYTHIPPKKPADWPEIIANEARLGRFVYAGTQDYMRKVSEHVSIGRRYRAGRALDDWFILCREEAAAN